MCAAVITAVERIILDFDSKMFSVCKIQDVKEKMSHFSMELWDGRQILSDTELKKTTTKDDFLAKSCTILLFL